MALYAEGFLIVLLGSVGQCSHKALVQEESELLFFLEKSCLLTIFFHLVSSATPIISVLCYTA